MALSFKVVLATRPERLASSHDGNYFFMCSGLVLDTILCYSKNKIN